MSSGGKLNPDAKYLSIRGPHTYEKLKENNIDCEPIFGDPALLMPKIYQAGININTNKILYALDKYLNG